MSQWLILILLPLSAAHITLLVTQSQIFSWVPELGARLDHGPQWRRILTTPIRASTCEFCFNHWSTFGVCLTYILFIPNAMPVGAAEAFLLYLGVLALSSLWVLVFTGLTAASRYVQLRTDRQIESNEDENQDNPIRDIPG